MSHHEPDPTIPLGTHIAVPLCFDLGLLEDWLLHCGRDTLDELADFAYHGTGNPRFAVTELIADLGRYSVALHRLLDAHSEQPNPPAARR
jgi:hypothetical protein